MTYPYDKRHPMTQTMRWARILLASVIASFTALAHPCWSQSETPPGKEIELGSGVKLVVPTTKSGEHADLAGMLEQYARQLRGQPAGGDAAPTPPIASLPVVTLPPDPGLNVPSFVSGGGFATPAINEGSGEWGWILLPPTLLWQPPLANAYEPRTYLKATSLKSSTFPSSNDFNIGLTMALAQYSPDNRPREGFQIDLFTNVISRFGEKDWAAAHDFRVGLPLTFAWGSWSGKIAYEHTSTHLGDEYMVRSGAKPRSGIREEAVLGLAYRPIPDVRLYTMFGYAVSLQAFNEKARPERYDFGFEWSRQAPTGTRGQPFAALDCEFRGETAPNANLTVQVGWQWLAEQTRPGMRIALEYFDGRAPLMQFSDQRESWVGLGLFFDY